MGFGDELIAAGQAQRWFDEWGSPSVIVDRNNKPRWHPIWQDNPAIVEPNRLVPDRGLKSLYHTIMNGPNARPYFHSLSEIDGWKFNTDFHARDHIAKIYLTDAERDYADRFLQALNGRRYVLIEPWSKHPNLRWPLDYWTKLVASRPDLVWVQHTHAGTTAADIIPGCFAQDATFRQACALIERSLVYIRGESGLCHAAAALRHPQVTIWGACMDWNVLGGYPLQIGVRSDGPPCGMWRRCEHCAYVMSQLTVEHVRWALDAVLDTATA